jgi:hypothetical protein
MAMAAPNGIGLAPRWNVDVALMLERCHGLETRSAALYRSFALDACNRADLCALWTAMAREEDEHARTLDDARSRLPTIEAWTTHLSGWWVDVVREAEEKLCEAERLAGGADTDQQLAAAGGGWGGGLFEAAN